MPAYIEPGLLRSRKVRGVATTMDGAALVLSEFNLDLCNSDDVALETAAQRAGADLPALEDALRTIDACIPAGPPPNDVLFPRFEGGSEHSDANGGAPSTKTQGARNIAPAVRSAGKADDNAELGADDPYSGASLVPMLVSGLVLIVLAMVAAVILS